MDCLEIQKVKERIVCIRKLLRRHIVNYMALGIAISILAMALNMIFNISYWWYAVVIGLQLSIFVKLIKLSLCLKLNHDVESSLTDAEWWERIGDNKAVTDLLIQAFDKMMDIEAILNPPKYPKHPKQ